jgi:hypothetical protein
LHEFSFFLPQSTSPFIPLHNLSSSYTSSLPCGGGLFRSISSFQELAEAQIKYFSWDLQTIAEKLNISSAFPPIG